MQKIGRKTESHVSQLTFNYCLLFVSIVVIPHILINKQIILLLIPQAHNIPASYFTNADFHINITECTICIQITLDSRSLVVTGITEALKVDCHL